MPRRSIFFALILALASLGCSDHIVTPEAPSDVQVEGGTCQRQWDTLRD